MIGVGNLKGIERIKLGRLCAIGATLIQEGWVAETQIKCAWANENFDL